MKTLFIAAGPIEWGSSRMRCYWPAKYMNADVTTVQELKKTKQIPLYDIYIFQKQGDPALMAELRGKGKQVWYDICDPVHWFSPDQVTEIIKNIDGVVASSAELADDFAEWGANGKPVKVILDRLEMSHFKEQRKHRKVDPVRLVWFGLAVNRIALAGAWAVLERLTANGYNIELTVMDDQPGTLLSWGDGFPVYYNRWELQNEVNVIAAHDIAILPPYPGPWGEVKSNNKRVTAAACGLPVASGHDYDELRVLVDDHNHRIEKAFSQIDLTLYDVRQSAVEWEQLLCS